MDIKTNKRQNKFPLNNIIDRIKEIANDTIIFPPKNIKELQNFLIVWYCDKYKIPITSGEAEKLEFETLLLEFYLSNRWRDIEQDIKSGKYEQEAQVQEDEKWLKEEMGEDYTEEISYLHKPTEMEKKGT